MFDLRDPVWQFIGVVGTFIGIPLAIIAIIIAWRQNPNKRLSYTISSTSLLNIKKDIEDRVKILFDDKPIKQVSLVLCVITNSGNREIELNDYIKPLCINFGQNACILSVDIGDTKPAILAEDIKTQIDDM